MTERFDPEQTQGPVIRDKRRVDPETGAVRDPEPDPGPAASEESVSTDMSTDNQAIDDVAAELEQARAEAAHLLDDLRRLQAEYVNYRRRVERDREAVREMAVAAALAELLPVLDDIDRARDHGDLNGAFKVVGEALEATIAKLGLVRYGEPGEPFDPTVHEALMHEYSDEVDDPTCVRILQPGYKFGERIVRPARVAVAEPTTELPQE